MAVTYGFYDSLNHDRLYNAQQMSAIFDGIINDGVFMSVGNQFHTVAGTGMQVIVKSGRAWFDSTWTLNDAEYPLSIDAADVLLTRIDAVVLEVNSEVATRANTIKVVKGTPASTPAKPTLTNTATIHQHALAYVTVAKNTTAITNSMIEIVVGKTETPYVTAILQTTDITDLFNQWEDYFQNWFDNVRSTLDGDVALNLQNQITSLRRETLKNTTPPIIGLPASATPDDMFQALAKTGDLHVWKKTVTKDNAVNASYTIDDVTVDRTFVGDQTVSAPALICWGANGCAITCASTFTLDPTTNVITLTKPVTYSYGGNVWGSIDILKGKFIYLSYPHTYGPENLNLTLLYYIPNNATFTSSNNWIFCDKLQYVNVKPYIPAGRTVTYPVSTNPNAYQEGSNAKPAGYTLGEVKTGRFAITSKNSPGGVGTRWNDSAALSVSDDGTCTLATTGGTYIDGTTTNAATTAKNELQGKFAYCNNTDTDFASSVIIFFPSNTIFTRVGNIVYADRYQPVTGYAAIPAGTTIEYLGKIGAKTNIQMINYVGTGVYGNKNRSSLTFDFVPKLLFVMMNQGSNTSDLVYPYSNGWKNMFIWAYGVSRTQIDREILYLEQNNKTISWYSEYGDRWQCNWKNITYSAIAIG